MPPFEACSTTIPGCWLIKFPVHLDERGSFLKPFEKNKLRGLHADFEINEVFISSSKAGVLRGLHFQLPPADHEKLVFCMSGRILDVVVDLRAGSPTFGQTLEHELRGDEGQAILIPKGLAHGFYTYEDNSILGYCTSSAYDPKLDTGLLWNSIDFKWPNQRPILSPRDSKFSSIQDFKTPFKFGT